MATFHDLFVISGDYSAPEFRQRFTAQARDAAQRADLLIAVSEFTAAQLVALLGVERSRIRVIPHGVDAPPSPPPPDSARDNVILHVGAIQKRKNLVRLMEAFERTPADWRLVLAGAQDGYGAGETLSRIAASQRRADILLPGYVSPVDLEALYARARVFAFPSLDEGFGMPVLDAMARGVPVLTSNSSALREVAGDSALLVDPNSVDAIAAGLGQLVGDVTKREEFRRRGLAHATRFTWTQAVDATWRVYAELL